MQNETFENDQRQINPQMEQPFLCGELGKTMKERNIGTAAMGATLAQAELFAGCYPVCYGAIVCAANFALILGGLAASL